MSGTVAPSTFSLDLEDAVLGGLLIGGRFPPEAGRLTEDVFAPHRRPVAGAVLAVGRRLGTCDAVAVREELAKREGGIGAALELTRLMEAVPSAASLDLHIRLLLDRAKADDDWPLVAPEALHGLAGEVVQAIAPFTEADPVAVLGHLLAAYGNIIGAGPHFRVEFTRHSLRLFIALVGETAKARKGQSWSALRFLFRQVDERWVTERLTAGLSSGEGLVHALRDERVERQPIRKGGRVEDYQDVVVDAGVADKRLLLLEEELAQALKVMRREGNILSTVLRQAWDLGDLHPLTKTNPIKATGAHISVIGHITREELLRHLSETEQANGFANRFIWLLVRRSKVIPNPTGVPEDILHTLVEAISRAVAFAREVVAMMRDPEAEALWAEVYPPLSEGKPGLLGAIIARAEAQVMRLACVYALLDRSALVRPPHLRAALALWDYAEASARRIFGGRLGHPVADRILEALRAAPEGLGETAIRDLFGRHRSGAIDEALDLLYRLGLARPTQQETGGRPRTVWSATKAT